MNISLDLDVLFHHEELILTDRHGSSLSFSPEQVVQKKVAMVLVGELCDLSKIRIAQAFGFATRKSYYDIRQHVLHGTLVDLLPQRTGPTHPTKRTKELETLVIQRRLETDANMYEITQELNRLGFAVGSRLVGQILADYGLTKKKR